MKEHYLKDHSKRQTWYIYIYICIVCGDDFEQTPGHMDYGNVKENASERING